MAVSVQFGPAPDRSDHTERELQSPNAPRMAVWRRGAPTDGAAGLKRYSGERAWSRSGMQAYQKYIRKNI